MQHKFCVQYIIIIFPYTRLKSSFYGSCTYISHPVPEPYCIIGSRLWLPANIFPGSWLVQKPGSATVCNITGLWFPTDQPDSVFPGSGWSFPNKEAPLLLAFSCTVSRHFQLPYQNSILHLFSHAADVKYRRKDAGHEKDHDRVCDIALVSGIRQLFQQRKKVWKILPDQLC